MTTTYHLDITTGTSNDSIANAYGDLDIVAYVARKAVKNLDSAGQSSVTLVEVEGIGGNDVATIVSLTADPGTVELVLRKRISELKKASTAAEAPADTQTVMELDTV